ncbi:MAG: phosphate ABC transporter substrate-binding protein [Actinomycetota bacterium]|nr:phosphate ABC transporter substrate-binding protein [Actinomycetota bacterium]
MGARRVWALVAVVASVLAAGCGSGASGTTTLRVSGSTTVNPVAADAAEVLRRQGLRITVDAQGGSAGGISQLGQGQVDVAMSSKPIVEEDRKAFPRSDFVTTEIGADAVGVIVRREVYDGGVKSLSKDHLKALFEGRIRSWRELGGPDVEVFVYDKEPGRGTREVIDKYLYGSEKAPPPPNTSNFAIVGGNEEGRAKVLSTPGGVTPLSTSFITGYPTLAAVAIDGVEPTPAHIVDRTYPMFRPLYLITDGPPAGAAKTFVDYVLSAEGQKLVNKHGYLNRADLGSR